MNTLTIPDELTEAVGEYWALQYPDGKISPDLRVKREDVERLRDILVQSARGPGRARYEAARVVRCKIYVTPE